MVAYSAVEVRQGALAIYSDSFSEIFDCKTKRFDVVLQSASTRWEKKTIISTTFKQHRQCEVTWEMKAR